MTKTNPPPSTIALNRKARHDYHILETFEAGIALMGWEVKSLRAGRAQLKETHVIIRRGEAYLLNAHFSALTSASTHVDTTPERSRKLLLHRRQLNYLMGKVEQKGNTIVPLALYWKNNCIKIEIALVQGKKLYDKRATEKDRDWERQKARIMRHNVS